MCDTHHVNDGFTIPRLQGFFKGTPKIYVISNWFTNWADDKKYANSGVEYVIYWTCGGNLKLHSDYEVLVFRKKDEILASIEGSRMSAALAAVLW